MLLCLAAVMLPGAGCNRGQSRQASGGNSASAGATTQAAVIRIGLVPERNIYQLRDSYRELADYLSRKLDQPVKVVVLNTYENVLRDFDEKQVDAAFLGSLVTVLAMDRHGARVLIKPEQAGGVSTYRGLMIVREDSPVQSIEQLRGKSIAVVRTTYAGALFAIAEMVKRGMYGAADAPKLVPAGTHDEAIEWLVSGRVDAATIKDLRLEAYRQEHPDAKFRVLVACAPVPNNALVVRQDLTPAFRLRLLTVMLGMADDPQARPALAALGAERFVRCDAEEYAPIYEMVKIVGPAWEAVGAAGAAPTTHPARQP
jgi:phosphonate transport system substrate-binding protein